MPLVFQARSFLAVPVLNPLQELTSCRRISLTPVGGSNFLLTFISWKKIHSSVTKNRFICFTPSWMYYGTAAEKDLWKMWASCGVNPLAQQLYLPPLAGPLAIVYLQSAVMLFSICLALHVLDEYLYCPVASAVFLGVRHQIILLTHTVEARNSLQRDKMVKLYFSPKSCRWCITFTAWFTSYNLAGRDGRKHGGRKFSCCNRAGRS